MAVLAVSCPPGTFSVVMETRSSCAQMRDLLLSFDGLSDRELAISVGVKDQRTVRRWRTGRGRPQRAQLERLQELAANRCEPKQFDATPGRGLRRWRTETGTTQKALATQLGTSTRTVRLWEGGSCPSFEALCRLWGLVGEDVFQWWPAGALRRHRVAHGLSIDAVASALSVPAERVRRWDTQSTQTPVWALRELSATSRGSASSLAVALRAARTRSELSVRQVADTLGVTVESVRGWERGDAVPRKSRWDVLCDLYGLDGDELRIASFGVCDLGGRSVARWRRQQGMSQRQLARQLGVSSRTVSRWETGASLPGPEICAALRSLGWDWEN